MRAGLAASTVTPGNTAPVASLTTPAKALCAPWAYRLPGRTSDATITTHATKRRAVIGCTSLDRSPTRLGSLGDLLWGRITFAARGAAGGSGAMLAQHAWLRAS